MTYGVIQGRDWNALTDDEFRAFIRKDFEENYPAELRHVPRRLRWSENGHWYLRMAAKGWIAPNWPIEYGGMGLDARKLLIFIEGQERWGIGRFADGGPQVLGPTLIRWGTEQQKRRYLPRILDCSEIWCQGYSEPDAGSDLAGLSTRAIIDGNSFVVSGRKIWTTLATDATHMFALVRTDLKAKKQSGISFILIDMRVAGVTVRPIRDLTGHEEFCEVTLDEVRVPVSDLVGELNGGWNVAKSLLGFERIFLGSPKLPDYGLHVLRTLMNRKNRPAAAESQDRFVDAELDLRDLTLLYTRFAEQVARGETLGDDVSMLKLLATELLQRVAALCLEVAGSQGAIRDAEQVDTEFVNALGVFHKARSPTIYGGTNEIQRNIIAKSVLRLPEA